MKNIYLLIPLFVFAFASTAFATTDPANTLINKKGVCANYSDVELITGPIVGKIGGKYQKKGVDVCRLQAFLQKDYIVLNPNIVVDGVYGNKLKLAVMDWQKEFLTGTADGIIGLKSVTTINQVKSSYLEVINSQNGIRKATDQLGVIASEITEYQRRISMLSCDPARSPYATIIVKIRPFVLDKPQDGGIVWYQCHIPDNAKVVVTISGASFTPDVVEKKSLLTNAISENERSVIIPATISPYATSAQSVSLKLIDPATGEILGSDQVSF